jgi:hypothetical protein
MNVWDIGYRCPYCKLYDESNKKCPNCGASLWLVVAIRNMAGRSSLSALYVLRNVEDMGGPALPTMDVVKVGKKPLARRLMSCQNSWIEQKHHISDSNLGSNSLMSRSPSYWFSDRCAHIFIMKVAFVNVRMTVLAE